jgi:S-adenosylmethionine:tRNA ribosyltransferase-isomerase
VLHVGIDTFAPVRAEKLDDHKMHGERVIIQRETSKKIFDAKKLGRRIVAVGTTTTRALESAALRSETGEIAHDQWTTDLFIKPGFEFKVVDAMLTNFHQPKSTLLVMISAFAGREFILSCYEEAIKERYRLFSFGDCMLIL